MLEIILGIIAVVALGFGAWQVRESWGETMAGAAVVAGLALTIFVPFGSIGAIAAAIWLYHQASTDQVRRLARRDDVETTDELGPRAPDYSPLLWLGAVVVFGGSIASTALFGLPTDRIGQEAAVAGFAGDEVEHAVPDGLVEDPSGPAADAPGAEQIEGHPPSGHDGYLYIEDRTGDIPLAVEDHAYEPLVDAVMANDPDALQRLVDGGNVELVDEDVPVEVLETIGPASRVEVTDGEGAGSAGWVPYRWTHETSR